MPNLFKIAVRNLLRYKRRTLLTASLITIGVVFVLVYISVSGSFKNMMTGQITDSMLGHLQVHGNGYVASIENLPQNLNLGKDDMASLEEILGRQREIAAYSPRIKLGALFSNFTETTNIRLNGIYPEREFKTVPLFASRITEGKKGIERGEMLVPVLLAKGMKVKVGDTVVIVATNRDGSVNGRQFKVAGILESVIGPGGRDGYVHIDDAMDVLRMEKMEVSEIAIRLASFKDLHSFSGRLKDEISKDMNGAGRKVFEVHTWEELSPFYTIARMIDVMTFFIKLMLIAIVLVSIMNVMIMAVYERIREIGTIAAIGTPPGKILGMFLMEGLCLGIIGTVIGNIVAILIVFIINLSKITFNFGTLTGLILSADVNPSDMLFISMTVIIISAIASLQPAFKASRMEPIKALRHV